MFSLTLFNRAGVLAALSMVCILAGTSGCRSQAQESSAEQAPPPTAVTVYTVKTQDVPVSQVYVGYTAGSREVEIRARVSGILERRLYQEGAAVAAGAPLFLIDPKPYAAKVAAAEAEVARAQARREQAEREVQRLRPLIADKTASRKQYDDANSDVAFARAELQAAQAALTEARLNLEYTHLSAPIAGITGQAQMVEGALVSAGDSLLTTLVQIDPMYVHFSLSENDWLTQQQEVAAGTLKQPINADLEVRVRLANGQLLERVGRIDFQAAEIDTTTGTVAMRATLPNADQALKAGQFVRVIVSGAVRPNAVAVPQRAVLEGPQGKYVYVAEGSGGDTTAQQRPVEAGEWLSLDATPDAQRWLIRSGLKAGERVILDNLIKLYPGAPVQLVPATVGRPAAASTGAA
ncbi:MAG: efflux RND transporter periplasmic adaptor subunit [Candidatus Competibacteraceae bacterium]